MELGRLSAAWEALPIVLDRHAALSRGALVVFCGLLVAGFADTASFPFAAETGQWVIAALVLVAYIAAAIFNPIAAIVSGSPGATVGKLLRRGLPARFFAAGLVGVLAVSLACGIGAAALAGSVDALDASFQDQALFTDDQELEQAGVPAKDGGKRDCVDGVQSDLSLAAAGAEREPIVLPDQLDSPPPDGGRPRTLSPTGPPHFPV